MRRHLAVLVVVLLSLFAAVGADANEPVPGGTFFDDDGNTHEGGIEAIAAEGITKGCNPPQNTEYCPSDVVSRGAMAAFLRRALKLPASEVDFFSDDDGSIFEGDINAIAAAGVTKGCNPPANTLYCPNNPVTRGAMAAFLVRGFGYTDDGGGDLFTDDDGSIFENDIDKLGTAGVTKGCNPPSNTMFCPNDLVVRDTMASFLSRALKFAAPKPPARSDTLLGERLSLLDVAESQGCGAVLLTSNGTTEECSASTSFSSGELFYVEHGWLAEDWSFRPVDERQDFISDSTRFDLSINELPLSLFESFELGGDDVAHDIFRFQFHGNLSASTHTLVGEWIWNDLVELRIILDVTITP